MPRSSGELREIVSVGGPRALSLLGFVLMTAVDVAMVAPLGGTAVAGLALATAYAGSILILAINVFAPVDMMVARALATDDRATVTDTHRSSIALVVVLAIPVVLLLAFPAPLLRLMGGDSAGPEVLEQATAFAHALAWGAPPALGFYALRLFVEGHRLMKMTTWMMVGANAVNVAGNWILIYGHLGAPELGAAGSAWSTSIVRACLCLGLIVYIARTPVLRENAGYHLPWRLDLARMWRILSLGFAAGLRVGAREIYYAMLVVLVTPLGTTALTSHQVGFSLLMLGNVAQMGFGWGASILVARHHARGDNVAARRAVALSACVASAGAVVVATTLVVFAGPIAREYSAEPATVEQITAVLRVCALVHLAATFSFVGATGIFALLDMRYAAKVAIPVQFGLALPCAWLMLTYTDLGVPGVWAVTALCELIVGAAFITRFRARTAG